MVSKPQPVKLSWIRLLDKINSAGLDSMCFVYQFEGHPLFGPLVLELFSRLEQEKIRGFTSVLTLAEILSNPRLHFDRRLWQEAREKFYQTPNLTVTDIDSRLSEAASIIRNKYSLRLPDAIQVTTAMFHHADIFITNDEKFKKVREIKVILLKDFI